LQSDEVSILVEKNPEATSWFNNEPQKIVSVVSGMASALAMEFCYQWDWNQYKLPHFDCRVFPLPSHEVNNYFILRQEDWIRNSTQMVARTYFSQKQLKGIKLPEMKEMILEKGTDWDALDSQYRLGRCITPTEKEVSVKAPDHIDLPGGPETVMRKVWYVDEKLPRFKDHKRFIDHYRVT
jgi:tRNA(His) guanylyltransferase